MPDTSVALLRRLSHNSAAYRDPLAYIDWEMFHAECEWLPAPLVSLHGLPEFDALPEAVRRRLSQYEFINVMLCGLWLERLFLQRLSAQLHPSLARETYEYLLHELREEAGHSLMFMRAIEASGLRVPAGAWRPPRVADFVARHARVSGALFWLAVVIAEDVPDKYNRRLRQHGAGMHRGVREMATLHLIDEARHITFARARLDALLAEQGRLGRARLAVAARLLLRQIAGVLYFPPPTFYALAGLPDGVAWRNRALRNPLRRQFVEACLAPTARLLHGWGLLEAPRA